MAGMWGYARVSTDDQKTDLQVDALTAAGVPKKNIITDTVSGAAKVRPKFDALIKRLGDGDTLVVWKVCRLGRNLPAVLETARRLDAAGVRVVITTLGIDLKTPAGRLVFGLMAQLAEFERDQMIERINAGIAAAKARGKALGRRHSLTAHQRREAARMVDGGKSLAEVAETLGVGKSIIFRAVWEARAATATLEGSS